MPRPRFTVRQVMLAVLLIAALLAAFEAGRRWERERTASLSQRLALLAAHADRIAAVQFLQAHQALQAARLEADKAHAEAEKAHAAAEP